MTTDKEKKLRNIINKMLKSEENKLKIYVLQDLLNQDDIKSYMEDLQNHGCISGMVSGLIYFSETREFFFKYEDEIENLISDNMDFLEINNRFEFIKSLNGSDNVGNLAQELNLLSWFAYEETAYKIYSVLFEEVLK